jgi:multidrug efflux system membrane fusion protein
MAMPKSSKTKLYCGLLVGVIVICLVVWMAKGRSQSNTTVEDIQLVRTQVVSFGEAGQSYTYAGEVRGRYESQLAFQVSGKIVKRQVELGSIVKAGETLMQIDPIDIRQGFDSRDAGLQAAQSQFKLAKDNLDRFKELYEQKFMSKAEFDRYQNAYDSAEAVLRQAKAQYKQGANQLQYCNLYADSAGVVMAINAEIGQIVGPGQPVVTVVRSGEREIEINVPENRLQDLNKEQRIEVTFWALPNVAVEGKVREVAPMADKVTRTYKVRISLLNPPPELKLGMTATAKVVDAVGQATAYVPLSAIYQSGDTPAVWVVSNGKADLRPIKIGEFGDEQVQVLSGLRGGDTIVTAGVHKLREGEKVRTGDDVE